MITCCHIRRYQCDFPVQPEECCMIEIWLIKEQSCDGWAAFHDSMLNCLKVSIKLCMKTLDPLLLLELTGFSACQWPSWKEQLS